MRVLLIIGFALSCVLSCGANKQDMNPKINSAMKVKNGNLLNNSSWSVVDGRIFDPLGNKWIGRGANLTNLMGREDFFIDERIKRERNMGFNFIRLWTVDHNSKGAFDMVARAAQVKKIVDKIASQGMHVMIVMWDTYKDLWGKEKSIHYDSKWWNEDYKKDFLKWTKILVNALKGHPAVFLYQLVNEGSCRENCAEAYLEMYRSAREVIHAIDDRPLISPGGLSIAHAIQNSNMEPAEFVNRLLQISTETVWTNSIYNFESPNIYDLKHISAPLATIATEYGFCVNGNPDKINPKAMFFDRNHGPDALLRTHKIAGLGFWEATESNCGYANKKYNKFNLRNEIKAFNSGF